MLIQLTILLLGLVPLHKNNLVKAQGKTFYLNYQIKKGGFYLNQNCLCQLEDNFTKFKINLMNGSTN